jgi:hypothetical protein
MEAQRAVVVVAGCLKLVCPMNPAPLDDHHTLFLGVPEGRHHLVPILPQLLGITVGHDFREDFRGPILDGPHHAEQHAAAEAAPGAIRSPGLAFATFFAFDVALAQWTYGEASALGFVPPARSGQRKAPQARCVFIKHNALAPARLLCESRELESARGESRWGRSKGTRRAIGASVLFFHRQRTLSRPSRTPV